MNYFHHLHDFLFDGFLEGIIVLLLFTLIVGKKDFFKQNKLRSLVFCFVYYIVIRSISEFIPFSMHSFVGFFFLFSIVSFITKTNVYTSLIATLIITIIFGLTESMILIAFTSAKKINVSELLAHPSLKLFATFSVYTLKFILLFFAYKFNFKKIFKFNLFNRENYFLSIVLLQLAILTLIIGSTLKSNHSLLFYAFILFVYLTVIVIGILDYKERERMVEIQKKYLVQEEYIKNMDIVVDVIRKEKHDFANHLNTLIAMCLLRKPETLDEVETYARKLLNNTGSSYKFYNTGNNYVDGLLAVKSNYAHEHNIHLDVELEAPLTDINIDDVDLSSTIGNIIDNAFDAILLSPEKKDGIVAIYTYLLDGRFYLSISNNGAVIPQKDMDNIFKNKFSTKSTKGNAVRGYGLFITKQVIEKNGGKISVSSTENETEFLIELNLKNKQEINSPALV